MSDTLSCNGDERFFADWGFSREAAPKTSIGNFKSDTFNVVIPGANIADDPVFPYEAFVIVRTNRANNFTGGTIEFQGKRVTNPLKASGKFQGVSYQFEGPWYDLSITQYLQTYKGATTNYNPGEVVLNTAAFPHISTAGVRFISVGDQIQAILQFVLDCYAALGLDAPFQYVGRNLNAGAIDLNTTGTAAVSENTDAFGNVYNFPLNAGTTIDRDLYKLFLKSEIIRPMSASDCLVKLLESSPRTNIGFDYSTQPPTISVRNIDNLAAVGLPLFNGTNHKSINLQRRDDLVPAAVLIGYRITSTVAGVEKLNYVVDKWGPNGFNSNSDPSAGPGVIVQILDLQGFSETFATGSLDCEALACRGGTHAQRRAWWSSKRGGETAKLEDTRVRFHDEANAATSIPNAKIYYASDGLDSAGVAVTAGQEFTAADYAFYTSRLVGGTHCSWMRLAGGTLIKAVKVKISAPVKFAEYDAFSAAPAAPATNANFELDTYGNNPRRVSTDLHVGSAELTNGVSGDYSTVASTTPGESYILGAGGIAQYLFNMLSTIQYDGEYVRVEVEFSGGISILNRVNFTGGRAEWATMKAQIQSIEKDWGTKETFVRIGVSRHLNAGQLSAFLNMWRFRRPWYNPAIRGDNSISSSGAVEMPSTAGHANTVEGLENEGQKTNTLYTASPAGTTPGVIAAQLNHDPSKIKNILTATTPTLVDPAVPAHVMEPREVVVCGEDGSQKYLIIHAGGAYTKP